MLLLHLSDIHFRKGEVGVAMDPNAHLRNELVRDAEAQCQAIGRAPDAVIVSGDIAFGGDPAEFTYALQWLEELCQRCGTSLSAVFVIPGNHDVVRAKAGEMVVQALHRDIKHASDVALEPMLRGLLSDDEAGRLLYAALQPYNEFAGRFFCDLLPPERTIARRDLRLNDGSTLRLSGFNSAFVSSAADAPGDLFVDPACFQLLRERGVEHLVICHHPPSWLRQGDQLRDYLNDVARVHMFGHEHTNRIEMGRDWVRIAASAAHPDRTEPGWEPGYNLVDLSVADTPARTLNVAVYVRVWQARPGEFRAKTDRGADVFRQSIALDAWSPPVSDRAAPDHGGSATAPATMSGDHDQPSDGSDPMDPLRDLSIRFFKLTVSQKAVVAGKLNLIEEDDINQPDFERSRRIFTRVRERGLVDALRAEIDAATPKH